MYGRDVSAEPVLHGPQVFGVDLGAAIGSHRVHAVIVVGKFADGKIVPRIFGLNAADNGDALWNGYELILVTEQEERGNMQRAQSGNGIVNRFLTKPQLAAAGWPSAFRGCRQRSKRVSAALWLSRTTIWCAIAPGSP